MFVSLFDTVRNLSIGPHVSIRCDNPIHRISLGGSLSLGPLTLRELDFVDLLKEQGSVVILIEDLDDDPDGGGFRRNAVVSNGDLKRKMGYYCL